MEQELNNTQRIEKGMKTTIITILVNMVLAFIKIFTGIIGHTYALIADGIESLADIFTSLVVFGGFRIGAIPPDTDHPYGHAKAESLAALFVSLALTGIAIGIAFQSVREVVTPHYAPAPYTLIILVGVIVTKELLFRFLLKRSGDLDSLSLKADAWHSRSDSLTSLAAFVGISISLRGGGRFVSADDWAALFASGIILFNAFRILKSAVIELMDTAPGKEVEDKIRKMARQVEGVINVEKCRMRKCGHGLFLEIHIEVDSQIPVSQGHKIAHHVKSYLMDSDLKVIDAVVHVEPAEKISKMRSSSGRFTE